MSLDQTTRGVLEQIIDGIIRDIPNFIKIIYNPSEKTNLNIQNESAICTRMLHFVFKLIFRIP